MNPKLYGRPGADIMQYDLEDLVDELEAGDLVTFEEWDSEPASVCVPPASHVVEYAIEATIDEWGLEIDFFHGAERDPEVLAAARQLIDRLKALADVGGACRATKHVANITVSVGDDGATMERVEL